MKIVEEYSLQKIAEMCIKAFLYTCRFARDGEIVLTQLDTFVWLFAQYLSDPDAEEFRSKLGELIDVGEYDVSREIREEAPRAISREEYFDLKLHALFHRTWHPDRSLVKELKRQSYESLSPEEVQEIRKEVDAIESKYK